MTWRGTRRSASTSCSPTCATRSSCPTRCCAPARARSSSSTIPGMPRSTARPTTGAASSTTARERPAEWTAVWLPNFLTEASLKQLGQLVRLDYVLSGDTFDRLAAYLSPGDRPAARTPAREPAVRPCASGSSPRSARPTASTQPSRASSRSGCTLGEQFIALDAGLPLQPPAGTSLRAHARRHRRPAASRTAIPKHPEFTELVSPRRSAPHARPGRCAPSSSRTAGSRTSSRRCDGCSPGSPGRSQLGTMYPAHFVADVGTLDGPRRTPPRRGAARHGDRRAGAPLARRRRHPRRPARPHAGGRRPRDPARRGRDQSRVVVSGSAGRRSPRSAGSATTGNCAPRSCPSAEVVGGGAAAGRRHGHRAHEQVAVGNSVADLGQRMPRAGRRRPGSGSARPRPSPRGRLRASRHRRRRPAPHREGGDRARATTCAVGPTRRPTCSLAATCRPRRRARHVDRASRARGRRARSA